MKYPAFGTKLLISGSLIAQVRSITPPGLSADTVDVTTHDSTGAWEEVLVTILRSGEVTLELVFDPGDTEHALALANLEGKLLDDFELQFPDSGYTAFTFNAYVVGFSAEAPVDGELSGSLTLKITGVPVLDSTYSP